MDEQNFQNQPKTQVEPGKPETVYIAPEQVTGNVPPVQPQKQDNSTLAIVSLVLGILSMVTCCCYGIFGILFGIGGIVCAVLANRQGKNGLATAGFICSIIGIVLSVICMLVLLVALVGSVSTGVELGAINKYDYFH